MFFVPDKLEVYTRRIMFTQEITHVVYFSTNEKEAASIAKNRSLQLLVNKHEITACATPQELGLHNAGEP